MVRMIVAKSKNNVIGKDNKLPWSIPEELKLFKTLTTNNVVLMGRKTYESIGKELPNRVNVVISRNKMDGIICFDSIEKALIQLKEDYPDKVIYVIGGEAIYEYAHDYCDEIIVSEINVEVEGDAFFNQSWLDNFYLYDSKNMGSFFYNRYVRPKNT